MLSTVTLSLNTASGPAQCDTVSAMSQLDETYVVTLPTVSTFNFAMSTLAVECERQIEASVSLLSSLTFWPSTNSLDVDMLNTDTVPRHTSAPKQESQIQVAHTEEDAKRSDATNATEPSSSSKVDALVAAVYGYESWVITEQEAREKLWWHSLVFVDTQSTEQGTKRKREFSYYDRPSSKKFVCDNDCLDLCDTLGDMKIDVEKATRSYLGVNASLYAAQIVPSRLCLGAMHLIVIIVLFWILGTWLMQSFTSLRYWH